MSFTIRKVDDDLGIWDDTNCEFVNPETLDISREQIEKYLVNKPYPENDNYNVEDMIVDVTSSNGSYIIPSSNENLANFIVEMLNELHKGNCHDDRRRTYGKYHL